MKLPKELPKAIYLTNSDDEIQFFAFNPDWEIEDGEQMYMTNSGSVDSYQYEYYADADFTYITKNGEYEYEEDFNDETYPFHENHKKIKDSITINIDKLSDKDWDKLVEQIEENYEITVL